MIRLHDVRVDQIRNQLGFADEVLNELLLVGIVLPNHFDGDAFDELARAALLGFVHNPHAAFGQLARDLVPKLVLNREEGHALMLRKPSSESSLSYPGKDPGCIWPMPPV